MNEEIKESFEMSIKIWTEIAEIPDDKSIVSAKKIKQQVIKKLGLPKMYFNCPFCERLKYNSCTYCPIILICKNEYFNYTRNFVNDGGHSQELAKRVLDRIVCEYEEFMM